MRRFLLTLATASFVGYFLFLHGSLYYEREPVGISNIFRPGGVYVTDVTPGYPAALAGFDVGDRLIAMDGIAIGDSNDMQVVIGNVPIGTASTWQLERSGTSLTVTMRPLSRRWIVPQPMFVVATVVFTLSLALGLMLAWRGPPGTSTLLGAWLLAALACVFLPLFPNSYSVMWRGLPAPMALLLWPAAVSSIWVHILLFIFCARVPRPMLSPMQLTLALLPGIGVGTHVTWYSVLAIYAPGRAVQVALADWYQFAGPLTYPIYFFGAALLLLASVRGATDVNDRRRARALLAGVACGGVGILGFAVGLTLQTMGRRVAGNTLLVTVVVLFSMLPLSFAYATFRHKLFDLRVIVRLGLQYALARGLVLGLVPVALAGLVLDVLIHGDQSLRSVIAERGWSYAAVAAITLVAYSQREQWMAALDRRFFRERYAAQQILRDVVTDIGQSDNLDTAARHVVSRIDSALHPTMAAVLRRAKGTAAFTAIGARPGTAAIAPLPATNAVAKVVRALGRPVSFGTQGLKDLPQLDQAWLAEADIELIVPIVTGDDGDEALLVLGPRRSEEPYSREDIDLLGTIAASLGLLAGRSPAVPAAATETITTPASLIGDRYRIESLIGQGGMGVVFAAIDERLGRPVAVKLMREEHLNSADGRDRFQHEARAAASLSHPNIVTVHDFGVNDEGVPYLVMERLTGRSLRAALRAEPRVAPERAWPILREIASAIEAAHARGMVHRDLKPENVFLAGTGSSESAKVLDFGIAKFTGETHASTGFATASGLVVGTLAYMSPEQAGGGTAAPHWDVWSLTVIAYEMLSGVHPFSAAAGGNGLPISRPAPIRQLAPELSVAVESVFDRALAMDPAGRFQTASATVSALVEAR